MEVNLTAYRRWSARFRWAWRHINRTKWGADVLVGIGVALLALVFLPDSVANGELIAVGLGFGGAAWAELVKFVMRLDKAPTEMLAEDYRELSRAYDNTTKELETAKKENRELLQAIRQSDSTVDEPSLNQVRTWKEYIENYPLDASGPLGPLNLIFEAEYAEMKPHLTKETRKRIEDTNGAHLSLSVGRDVRQELRRLTLRDLTVVERAITDSTSGVAVGCLHRPAPSSPFVLLTGQSVRRAPQETIKNRSRTPGRCEAVHARRLG